MRVHSLRFQQGAATILMSILVGFSITAMGLALMFNIQSAQDKQITAQAQVNAQSIAWAGSEAFRQVLTALPDDELKKLAKDNVFGNADGANNRLTPRIFEVKNVPAAGVAKAHKEVTVDLVAIDPAAQVGTTLQVVYSVFESATAPKPDPITQSTFNYDTQAEGTVSHPGGNGENIAVNGDFNVTSSVSGVSSIFATGNVKIEVNNIVLKDVFANGIVTMQSNGNVLDSLVGLDGVDILQGFAGSVFSNSYVKYKSSKPPQGANAIVKSVESAGHNDIDNLGLLEFTSIRSNSYTTLKGGCDGTAATPNLCFKKVEARGDLSANPINIEEAFSLSAFNCIGGGQPGKTAQAPSFKSCDDNKTPTKFSKATPVIPEVQKRAKRDLSPLPIDVWDQEIYANYVVRFDKTLKGHVITVKNVNRIGTTTATLEGQYGLVRKDKDSDGYLCPIKSTSYNASSNMLECSETLVNLFCTKGCWESAQDTKILDSAGTKDSSKTSQIYTYRLKDYVAPGVILFDGNLVLKHASVRLSAAALLAAGYISTEDNNSQTVALNFAGAEGGDVKDASGKTLATLPGVCKNLAGGKINLIPSNFCLPDFNSAAANNLGNVALMAGGQPRTVDTITALYKSGDQSSTTTTETIGQLDRVTQTINKVTADAANNKTTTETIVKQPYYGGDIRLAAQNVVYGSVLAGNLFKAEGDSKIYGYVVSSASALLKSPKGGGTLYNAGGLQLSGNGLTSKTTLDHSVTHGEYDGGVLPGTSNPDVDPPSNSGEKVQLLRARYL